MPELRGRNGAGANRTDSLRRLPAGIGSDVRGTDELQPLSGGNFRKPALGVVHTVSRRRGLRRR